MIFARFGLLWLLMLLAQACGSNPKTEVAPESAPDQRRAPSAAPVAPTRPVATTPQVVVSAAPEAPTDVTALLKYDPTDPLANLEAADALDKGAQGRKEIVGEPPKHGCVLIDAGRRVWPAPGPAAIAAAGDGFVVAGYAVRDGREQLFLVHLDEHALPEPITAFDITPAHPQPRVAPPGLAARDVNDVTVAYTDGKGRLVARRLRIGRGGTGPALELATGVDTRFAPAVTTAQDLTLVAWTAGTTPMHTHLAVIADDAVRSRHDLTPSSMGAAAPSFVSGATPPVLVVVDARNGMSPILRIEIGNDGVPEPASVALPVGMVSSPPQLCAASSSSGTYVGYAGLGAAATSAIGLVSIAPIVGTPEALIKGTGYGQLTVSAVTAPRAIVIAADAPTAPAKDAPREIHVYVVGMQGAGPAALIRGAGGASHAAVARSQSGIVAVAFTGSAGVYVARLRCDDGG